MVAQVEDFAEYVQVDIMDGQFVPSRSITAADLAVLTTKLPWEAHLMVMHPGDYLEGFRQAGANRVVFHYRATPSPLEVIAAARCRELGVGLAVNPETTLEAIQPLISQVDSVLVLTVNPGFYGSKFLPEVLGKVTTFIQEYPGVEVGIDGGIKEDNIAQVAKVGVDYICVGSAIFQQPQPEVSYRHLQVLAAEGS
jgi:ribulose-phosphate 3-epimerase